MDWWIEFAKGPLFTITFLIMMVGLLRHVFIQVYYLFIAKGARLKNVAWKSIFSDMATWVVPVGHMISGTVFFSVISFILHIGIIILSVLLVDHIVLWEGLTGLDLPSVGRELADWLTLLSIACTFGLLLCRIFLLRLRAMSRVSDYVILLMLLMVFVFGYMAGHPAINPFSWNFAMLLHLLSAEALFVIVPFTKLAHIVLYFFDRLSPIHWQLNPGAGAKVADALFGKEARV